MINIKRTEMCHFEISRYNLYHGYLYLVCFLYEQMRIRTMFAQNKMLFQLKNVIFQSLRPTLIHISMERMESIRASIQLTGKTSGNQSNGPLHSVRHNC